MQTLSPQNKSIQSPPKASPFRSPKLKTIQGLYRKNKGKIFKGRCLKSPVITSRMIRHYKLSYNYN